MESKMPHFSDLFEQFNNAIPRREGVKKARKTWPRAVRYLINILVTALYAGVSFYVTLPVLDFHFTEFYTYIFSVLIVFAIVSFLTRLRAGTVSNSKAAVHSRRLPVYLIAALVIFAAVGTLLSAQIFRASSYRDLLQVENGSFTEDVKEISFEQIPMLDKDSAERLGDRRLGDLPDMVSQFEVSNEYSQINYNDRPVRVTPLQYGDLIKWFNNRSEGIPAYVMVDMVTQEASVIRLDEGKKIRYTTDEHFSRYLMRHLRFRYPTYQFSTPTFEIDEQGDPYWICPRIVKRIGLFGGTDVAGAVLVNAATGECTYYSVNEVPQWVDRVYPADLIIEQYDFHGTYVNGFFNSIFGQSGVTVTTDGYNYLALNDDVYLYTGVTSVGGDKSNIGFILVNQRTKEAKYYPCAGAQERSAMSSAEGVVQHLAYQSTFPLLLNISDQPTYFMALKDSAQLVKMYAMVNVQQYQIVATGATVEECEKAYIQQLAENKVVQNDRPSASETVITGQVAEIRSAVIDGNTYYYIRLEEGMSFYRIAAAASPDAILLNPGDRVTIGFTPVDTAIVPANRLSRS